VKSTPSVGNWPTSARSPTAEAAIRWRSIAGECEAWVVTSTLPDGWTLDRVRALSGDATAALLSTDRLVVVELPAQADYEPLPAEIIIGFHDLCLVTGYEGDDWYMGQLDSDGSVVCWASYGTDLSEAIRSL